MKQSNWYLTVLAFSAIGVAVNAAMADDAAGDWGDSMSYSNPSEVANRFNAAQALLLLRRDIVPGSDNVTNYNTNCQVAGACPSGGTITQWNGVTVNTISGSNGITIDNTIDATSDQNAGSANCQQVSNCVTQ